MNHNWLSWCVILAGRNVDVGEIISCTQQWLPSELTYFKSIDTASNESGKVNYPTEFFNSLDMPQFTPHSFCKLNPSRICNDTRLVTKRITGYLIQAIILNEKFKKDIVLLPDIHNDTVGDYNSIQAVSRSNSFSIGNDNEQYRWQCQYVAWKFIFLSCTRVGKPSKLFILTKDGLTKNVVYQMVITIRINLRHL